MIVKTELKILRVEYEDAVFVMRQISTSALTDIAVLGQKQGAGATVEETFVKTVIEWENVNDSEKPLECNDVNKRTVFLVNPGLADTILTKFEKQLDALEEEEKKILKRGQVGISTPAVRRAKNAKRSK